MTTDYRQFDPLAYIESAFLDTNPQGVGARQAEPAAPRAAKAKRVRFRKTAMSAPRPRRTKDTPAETPISKEFKELLEHLPRNLEFLGRFFDDSVTAHYYHGDFKESREDLIRRLVDPELTLEEAARLLGVCPTTVRRYTNRGWLSHHRTPGGQRRFRLSGLVKFVDEHGRFPEGAFLGPEPPAR
jgi:excisionase family DNA binding protein